MENAASIINFLNYLPMSTWKVSKERIELFPHPNAEKLELGKLGTYQVVVQKGVHSNGNTVVFIPEKSVVPEYIRKEFENYLAGPEKNRVKAVRLRDEYSCGVILPLDFFIDIDISKYDIGEDISMQLGIKKYEPPIPSEMAGEVQAYEAQMVGRHDCEHFGVYMNEFEPGERIVVTEKLHGTQGVFYYDLDTGYRFASSKGLLDRGLQLKESETNVYYRAAKASGLWGIIREAHGSGIVQVFGEVVPVQKGYTYGQSAHTVKLFDVRVDGRSVPYDQINGKLREMWVPVLYDGPLDVQKVRELAQGNETVSGRELHIKEGVVVRPYIDRSAKDSTKLRLKVLNPKYKETGEEFN
jgi:RNA ligase (TIGR02306 family)